MFELWSKKLLCGGEAKLKEPIRFDYTGAVQTFVVPSGVHEITVDCVGAAGGTGPGYSAALGGRVQCLLKVNPGQTLYIYCGASGDNGGFNGGGTSGDGVKYGGGGASDIRTIEGDLNSRIIVSGGGGGRSAAGSSNISKIYGGPGGGLIGGSGLFTSGYGATGGTQTEGGYNNLNPDLTRGSFGKGASYGSGAAYYRSAAGGGGWYGGGFGIAPYGGGGGGSSYTNPDRCSDVVHTQGYSAATGNGWIILS